MNKTTFDELYDWFLLKITDIDIISYEEDDRELVMQKYLRFACTRFSHYCRKGLLDYDEDIGEFNNLLTNNELDILSELMVLSWLKPKLNHYRQLENLINTTDFNSYSPANMLTAIRNLYEEREKNVRLMMNEYTFWGRHLRELKENE